MKKTKQQQQLYIIDIYSEDIVRDLIRSAVKGNNSVEIQYLVSMFRPDKATPEKLKEYKDVYYTAWGKANIYFDHTALLSHEGFDDYLNPMPVYTLIVSAHPLVLWDACTVILKH